MLSNDGVNAFYRSTPVDLFVNCSESEGIPVSIMEAQSFGVPVVAPQAGGVPEIVNEGKGCLLPAHCKSHEPAEAMQQLVSSSSAMPRRRAGSKDVWGVSCDAAANYADFASRLADLTSPDRA